MDEAYDYFHIEHSDNILDIYYELEDYRKKNLMNIHNNSKFSSFFNLIFDNTDYNETLEYIHDKTPEERYTTESEYVDEFDMT